MHEKTLKREYLLRGFTHRLKQIEEPLDSSGPAKSESSQESEKLDVIPEKTEID